jgi:serine/threonine protein kinase
LQHPYLAPSIEVAVKLLPESLHVFVLRPFFPKGSLRDLLFSATPTASYTEKYLNKRGSPLKISQIAKIGRQVLEACCYMSDNGVPLYHLHAGNVLLDPNGDVRLSDYENALLGCISKYHKKMQSACSAYVSSDIVSFGYLLLEMATGQPIRRAVPDPAVFQALPLDLQVLVPTLQKIFPASKKQAKANGTLSWHKLRDDPLFAGAMSQSVAVEPFQFDERTSQALAATRMFFDEVYSPDAADSTPSAESDKKKTKKKKSKSSKSSSAVVQIDEDDEVDSHAISMTATTTTTTVTDSPRQPSKRPSLLGGVASDRTQTAKFKVTSSDAAIRAVLGDDASRMGDESDEDDEDDDDFIFGKPNASVDDLFGARRPTSMFAPKKGGDMWKDMDDE